MPVAVFLLLMASIGELSADWRIRQVAYLNRGTYWDVSYIVPYRHSHDSILQLVFAGGIPATVDGVYFYRYLPVNRYEIAKIDTGGLGDSTISPGWMEPFAAGDVDGDSEPELIAGNSEYLRPSKTTRYVWLRRSPRRDAGPATLHSETSTRMG